MMVPILFLASGLLSLAMASPPPGLQASPLASPPSPMVSKGFRLVFNVTDLSRDFPSPIHLTYVASIHVGPAAALVGNVKQLRYGRIFYQNGTAEEHRGRVSTIITDSGTPPYPSGLKLVQDGGKNGVDVASTARLDVGPGTPGLGIAESSAQFAHVYPETWMACKEPVDYYRGEQFVLLKHVQAKDGDVTSNVPRECAPVSLIPECTQLNVLPDGSYSSHEYALDSACYRDVSSIKWS